MVEDNYQEELLGLPDGVTLEQYQEAEYTGNYTTTELLNPDTYTEPVDATTRPLTAAERDQMLDDWEAEDRQWWAERQARRSQQAKALWGDTATTGRGAAGINSWLGGGNYNYSYQTGGAAWATRSDEDRLAIRLNQAMKFAADLGRIAARGDAKSIQWDHAGAAALNPDGSPKINSDHTAYVSASAAGEGGIVLSPLAVRRIGEADGPADQFEANSIIGGQAIHEGAHTRHTPANAPQIYKSNASLNQIGEDAAVTAGYMIEDAFVEACVLEEYPGYQDYLDDQWHFLSPANTIREALGAANAELTMDGAIELIQDMGRRYDDYGDEERAVYDALPEDTRRLLHHGAKIMDKGHNPKLDLIERQAIANQLIRLLKDGEIPPEDLAPGEEPTVPTPAGDLEGALQRLAQGERGHESDGSNQSGNRPGEGQLTSSEHFAAEAEARSERFDDENPWPTIGEGDRKPVTEWLTPDIDHLGTERYRESAIRVAPHVKRLAKALHFRASQASRQQTGQLRGRLNDRSLGLAATKANPNGTRRIFKRREILEAPRVHISLLVDISGSTSSENRWRGFLDTATMIDGALTSLERESPGGVTWDVHAHTSGSHVYAEESEPGAEDEEASCCILYRLLDPKHQDRERLGYIWPQHGNYDGEAVFSLCRRLDKEIGDDRQKVLLHLSDGLPSGLGYGGQDAYEQMAWVVGQYRKKGFTILTLYVGSMASGSYRDSHIINALTRMYGPQGQGWVHVPTVADLPQIVGGIVSKALYFKA